MNKRRVFAFVFSAVLAWVIVDIYFIEVKKRGELVALCAFAGQIEMPKLSPAAPSARASIQWIASTAGISPNFEIFAGDKVSSIAFAAFQDGRRIIVYDMNAFRWGDNAARWRDVVVLAHEIGHHLGAHLFITDGSAHSRELEADRFSGYAAALLGASLPQALSFTDQFSEEDSVSHPGRERRRVAITEGWQRGENAKRTSGIGVRENRLAALSSKVSAP